jgi:hypothetical protein
MRRFLPILLAVLCAVSLSAQDKLRDLFSAKAPEGFVEREWTVDGVKRTALVPCRLLLARAWRPRRPGRGPVGV